MPFLLSLGACDTAPQAQVEAAAPPPGKTRISVYRKRTVFDSTVRSDKTVAVAPGARIFVRVEAQPFRGRTGWYWQGSTAIVDPATASVRWSR